MMAKAVLSLLLLLLSFVSGWSSNTANGQVTSSSSQTEGTKNLVCDCVAKPSSDQATLLQNINYACSQVDCRILQRGCPCFNPDNLINHASVAMNLYYQSHGRNHWNCDFRNSALVVITDPSYGNCIYE